MRWKQAFSLYKTRITEAVSILPTIKNKTKKTKPIPPRKVRTFESGTIKDN